MKNSKKKIQEIKKKWYKRSNKTSTVKHNDTKEKAGAERKRREMKERRKKDEKRKKICFVFDGGSP